MKSTKLKARFQWTAHEQKTPGQGETDRVIVSGDADHCTVPMPSLNLLHPVPRDAAASQRHRY